MICIADNTRWVIGDYPSEFNNIIDLYNTWVCFIMTESMDYHSVRYIGTRGDAIRTDTEKLGESIVEYINNGYDPNIGMISFMENVKDSRAFDKGFYEKAKGWFLDDVKYPVHIEHAFFKMIELFKVQSFKKALDAAGINISFCVTG